AGSVDTAAAVSVDSAAEAARLDHAASLAQQEHMLYAPHHSYIPQLSHRLGFGMSAPRTFEAYPEAATLRAGWYHDWTVQGRSSQIEGMQYVQTVRIHQDLECPTGTDFNRDRCPYVEPYSYTVRSGLYRVGDIARRFPGTLWIIGNEMDRVDWGRPAFRSVGYQDEMMPGLYAQAYHDIYWYIKRRDPSAKIAIGGIVQPTSLRLEYLTKVWDIYERKFGVPMPVDVWNTHNFILREGTNGDWGAGVPPGASEPTGAYVDRRNDAYHVDMGIFDQQIRAFREWMKERGQQEKPLIVTEYGVLYYNHSIFTNGLFANSDPTPTVDFMLQTFDYFLNTEDCNIGFHGDGCKLVQAWNWYIFNSDNQNHHGRLFGASSGEITPAGEAFRDWSLRNIDALAVPFPIP
ncbi:MAG: hypothetical protein WDZ49_10075, partial [Litorilinea sp.]